MGEANNESRRRMSGGGMEHLFGKYPNQRDLLQRFMAASSNNMNHNTHAGQSGYVKQEQQEEEEEEEEEGIELNLGLSLGGRFGIDKNAGSRKKLIRSTSVASSIPLIRDEYDAAMNPAVPVVSYHPTLIRTSSLPTETEEEWRKRKEMQTLRRMEAKRRRSEKQKNNNSNPRTDKDGLGSGVVADGEEERRCELGFGMVCLTVSDLSQTKASPLSLSLFEALTRLTRPVKTRPVLTRYPLRPDPLISLITGSETLVKINGSGRV